METPAPVLLNSRALVDEEVVPSGQTEDRTGYAASGIARALASAKRGGQARHKVGVKRQALLGEPFNHPDSLERLGRIEARFRRRARAGRD
jgi:hypothetical protein